MLLQNFFFKQYLPSNGSGFHEIHDVQTLLNDLTTCETIYQLIACHQVGKELLLSVG